MTQTRGVCDRSGRRVTRVPVTAEDGMIVAELTAAAVTRRAEGPGKD